MKLWWLPPLLMVLAGVGAFFYSHAQVPVLEATGRIEVIATGGTFQVPVATYQVLLSSSAFLSRVDSGQVELEARLIGGTTVFEIIASGIGTESVTRAVVDVIAEFPVFLATRYVPSPNVLVLDYPSPPAQVSPRVLFNVVLAVVLGGLIGLGAFLLANYGAATILGEDEWPVCPECAQRDTYVQNGRAASCDNCGWSAQFGHVRV